MKTLTNLTYPIVENCLSKNNKVEALLLINWSKIAMEYDQIIFPKKIIFYKNQTNKGKILLNVQQGFGLVIQMKIPMILDRINNFLGYKAIYEIKIMQTNLKNLS